MAGEIQLNSTTFATESGGTVTVSNVDSATNRTNLGLGSIATQASNSVDIDGGAIDGTTIGGITAAAGSFTDLQFNSGYGSVATAYGCRAWVNFNGTGTVAISASGNVSSITDIGPGNYRVNLTTALPDTNYAPIASGYDDGVNSSITKTTSPVTTSQVILICSNVSNTLVDVNPVTFCVFR